MKRSYWFTEPFNPVRGGGKTRHYLLYFGDRHPPAFADLLLAEKIGEFDPFVRAVESGRGCTVGQVYNLIAQATAKVRNG